MEHGYKPEMDGDKLFHLEALAVSSRKFPWKRGSIHAAWSSVIGPKMRWEVTPHNDTDITRYLRYFTIERLEGNGTNPACFFLPFSSPLYPIGPEQNPSRSIAPRTASIYTRHPTILRPTHARELIRNTLYAQRHVPFQSCDTHPSPRDGSHALLEYLLDFWLGQVSHQEVLREVRVSSKPHDACH